MASAISDKFRLELLKQRARGVRLYEIARAVNVRPNELSGLAAGSLQPRRDDPRVLRVAAFLGLTPEECFANAPESAVLE